MRDAKPTVLQRRALACCIAAALAPAAYAGPEGGQIVAGNQKIGPALQKALVQSGYASEFDVKLRES